MSRFAPGIFIPSLNKGMMLVPGLATHDGVGGVVLRGLGFCLQKRIELSPTDFWVLTVGHVTQEQFLPGAVITLSVKGLPPGYSYRAISPKIQVPAGSAVLIQIERRGNPESIEGLTIIPDVGVLGPGA